MYGMVSVHVWRFIVRVLCARYESSHSRLICLLGTGRDGQGTPGSTTQSLSFVWECGDEHNRKMFPTDLLPVVKGLPSRGDTQFRQDGNLTVIVWQDTKAVVIYNVDSPPTNSNSYSEEEKGRRQYNWGILSPCNNWLQPIYGRSRSGWPILQVLSGKDEVSQVISLHLLVSIRSMYPELAYSPPI